MPRTALTKVTSVNYADGIADLGFQAADQANGNSFVNTGKTTLIVTRSDGTVNITFSVGPNGRTINDTVTKTPSGGVVTIGNYAHFGDFRTEIYGNTVNIDYDTDTNVTVAVIEQEPTPL